MASLLIASLSGIARCAVAETGPTPAEALHRIADPHTDEGVIVGLIEVVRRSKPLPDEAKVWTQIANSDKFPRERRLHAMLQLFDRCVDVGMTVRDVAGILNHSLLDEKEQVSKIKVLEMHVPASPVSEETFFAVETTCFVYDPKVSGNLHQAIYLRVQGTPSVDDFYNALEGEPSAAADLKVTGIEIPPVNPADERLIRVTRGSVARPTPAEDLREIADPHTDEAAIVGLIEDIRRVKPLPGEARLWAQIVNSAKFTEVRRVHALLQLLDRCVKVGMTVREVARILDHPSWLKQIQIVGGDVLTGYFPILPRGKETLFEIWTTLSVFEVETSENTLQNFYVRVRDEPSVDEPSVSDLYDALEGKASAAAELQVTAIGFTPISRADENIVVSSRDPERPRPTEP